MRSILTSVLLVAALTGCAESTTTAQPDETSYLADVAVGGGLAPGVTSDELMGFGNAICQDYKNGATLSQEVGTIEAKGLPSQAAWAIATAAGKDLCPTDFKMQ